MHNVLIAEDEAHVRRVLRMSLTRAGFNVGEVPDGQAALEAIRSMQPDILITDIKMPRLDGRDLCLRILDEFPGRAFPIVVMTSSVEREHREWSHNVPGLWFLEKPVSPRALVVLLNEIIATETAGL